MKRVICNQCRVETPPDGYGMSPNGWIAVTRRTEGYREQEDYCSAACAVAALAPAPPVAAVPGESVDRTERALGVQ